LAGKVVAGPCMMAMPLFLFLCEGVADAHARAISIGVEFPFNSDLVLRPIAAERVRRADQRSFSLPVGQHLCQ
jgi:hypothetical protein